MSFTYASRVGECYVGVDDYNQDALKNNIKLV